MTIKVKAPGSCGELVQGTINGVNFLITCPVDWYSEVTVVSGDSMVHTEPKTATAVSRTFEYLNISGNLGLTVKSDLPVGKGMASSSADISAACQAAALAVAGRLLSCDEIADIALTIEPTDGIFYPGIIMFDHVEGKIRRFLGKPPPIYIAVFDVGGQVDTLAFNHRKDLAALNQAKEPQIMAAATLVAKGLETGDARLIGQGATMSAVANQSILYKPCLEQVITISRDFGAVGICAAHSGTVLGVMFSATAMNGHENCIREISRVCSAVVYLKTVRLIAGGLIITGDDGCDC
ncbi:L-threonine kinase [Sporomusa ovata DSM 2662]|uniref:Threonine kinase in B12 biosynthesis n=1 Tax=Sporomusa ovata TaxID=2378 RepID=A0A0U1KVW6_9FIRM|nr:serine/threonine protein kinase [Sporomusa ovata]EQB29242.1 threonine kinase [Sporomusa ovata DSM 2662]CQR71279.1 Threonine kinase in B12 biosynthesis [Sporomusa ovata]